MSFRLAAFLAGFLIASPALAETHYCEATANLAGGWLAARVIPEGQGARPMIRWVHGDRETGEVTLSYQGEPSDLRVTQVTVVVSKAGARVAAKKLHRVNEDDLIVETGGQWWRSYWKDRHRWADPDWTMSADARPSDAPFVAGGPLRLSLLPGRQPRPLLTVDLTTPGGPELAQAAARVLAEARDGLKTGKGCVEDEVDISAII